MTNADDGQWRELLAERCDALETAASEFSESVARELAYSVAPISAQTGDVKMLEWVAAGLLRHAVNIRAGRRKGDGA